MAGFTGIIGHEQTIEHLQQSILTNKVNHAYLLEGPDGSGKRMIAEAFARALQCEEGGAEGCGHCHSCKQADTQNHPDIILVTHEKPATISVKDVREQIVGSVDIRPYNGKYKIYIIPEAEKMNPQAQNALLKTLEEPPEYAVIILLTVNASALLDTIRSRCILLKLRPVESAVVQQYIMDHLQVPDYQARLCATFAQGSVGKALELANSEYFSQIRSSALTLVKKADEMDISELTAFIKEITAWKVSVNDFLDILGVWYRDVLYFKATKDADSLIFKDELAQIRQNASKASYEGLERVVQALQVAKDRLRANVSFELTMELLFLTIKDSTK